MSNVYHTPFGVNEVVSIEQINARLAALDEAIGDVAAAEVLAAIVYDSKATTTDGGSSSAATWNARDLNTEVDPDNLVTIDSNKFTPIAGTYAIFAQAPAKGVSKNRIRLYNVTQTSVVAVGLNALRTSDTAVAQLTYVFTADGADEYRIDHYTQSAVSNTGLGEAVDDGAAEVYTQVLLIKLG